MTAFWKIIEIVNSLPQPLGISPWIWIPLSLMLLVTAALLVLGKVPPSYVFGNLAVRWWTTLMTAAAFLVVIGLLTGMLAFVNGMYALTEASGHEENLMILSEGATDEGFSNLGFGDIGDIENQPGILRLNDSPLVSRETYLVAAQAIDNTGTSRPNKRFLQIRGIDDPAKASAVHELTLLDGGAWFSDAGVREGAKPGEAALVEVVLGEGIARQMWRDMQPEPTRLQIALSLLGIKKIPDSMLSTGDTFSLNDRTWLITGVMKSSGSTFDSELWAKSSLIGPMFGKESYSTLVARTANRAECEKLRDYFNTSYEKTALATRVETDYFKSLSETNVQFTVAIAVVTLFMAIGGLFGVMNTMYAAISQRIKDIGVLRLLGYRRTHILATFMLEAVAIALIGGIIGCAVGSICHGWTANSMVSGGPGGGKFVVLQLTVDAQIIAAGITVALFMGFAGGILPSIRAMRLTALETLR